MLGAPGQIYSDLLGGHLDLIYAGAGSVLCSLTNASALSQGIGAMLPVDDENYDAEDELRGLPSFTGISYDPDTGLVVSVDQAEIAIAQKLITVGRPEKGWSGSMKNMDGTTLNFRILDVMQDRTLGVFRIKCTVLKDTGKGRRINRAGEGGV